MPRKLILILLIFISVNCYAGQLPTPPPIKDQDLANYMYQVYSNSNNLTIVKVDPNGSRLGNYGDLVIYNNTGTFYIEICTSTPSGTVWKKSQLN